MDNRGLYKKFNVTRVDGTDQPGGKHEGCRYFVIDIDHDENAIHALSAYARRCMKLRPQLSEDLQKLINDLMINRAPETLAY